VRQPELSVIIPTYNRMDRLRRCLDALGQQSLPSEDFEVLVVVDGSADGTMSMLERLNPPFTLRSIWQENGGQASALNRGIADARGRFCLFIDDDIVVAPECLARHLEAQRGQDHVVAVGQLTLELPAHAGWYARAFAEGWRRHYQALNEGARAFTWEDCYSGNMSAPRNRLIECGGFDTGIRRGFDVELAQRLEQAGCTFSYLPGAVGCQEERKGFSELSRDIEEAGFADVQLLAGARALVPTGLASFMTGHPYKVRLTRILLMLRVPPRLLSLLGPLLPSSRHRYLYHSLIQNLCYWRGVRRASMGTELWAQIVSGNIGLQRVL